MIVQQLFDWSVDLKTAKRQKQEPHSGFPMMNGQDPETETIYVLVFTEKSTGNQIHYPFDEAMKQEFMRAFTGGVIIPQVSL